MISGKYLRSRLTKLITDRISIFSNRDLDVSDQYYTNDHTSRVYFKERQNPQMEYNWIMRLPDVYNVPSELAAIKTPPNYRESGFTVALDQIEHRIDSVTLPYDTFEVGTHTLGSGLWYSAQRGTIGQLTMIVDEYEDGATLSFFTHWMNLIKNDDGTHNPPAFYKRPIILYDIDSTKYDTHSTIFGGFFPISIEQSGRSQQGQGILQYTVTLAGDGVNHIRIPPEEVIKKLDSEQQKIVEASLEANGVLTDAPNIFVEGLDKVIGIKDIIF